MTCERLQELKAVRKNLQDDQRVLRTAKREPDNPEDALDFLIGSEPDKAISDMIRALGEAERENNKEMQEHVANCMICRALAV